MPGQGPAIIRATAGAQPRWGIPGDCLVADHSIDARAKTGTAPDEHPDRREPAHQSMLTDVSRLRSYRCTTVRPTPPTMLVWRTTSHASELDNRTSEQSRAGAPTLDCFGAPSGTPRNDGGESTPAVDPLARVLRGQAIHYPRHPRALINSMQPDALTGRSERAGRLAAFAAGTRAERPALKVRLSILSNVERIKAATVLYLIQTTRGSRRR
jgi:hypothetical protein